MARGSPFIYIGPNSDPREVDKSSWQERHEEWPATQNGQIDVPYIPGRIAAPGLLPARPVED